MNSPTDQFAANVENIRQSLIRLMTAADDHFSVGPDDVKWGHVADTADIAARLSDIVDRVYRRGEYQV